MGEISPAGKACVFLAVPWVYLFPRSRAYCDDRTAWLQRQHWSGNGRLKGEGKAEENSLAAVLAMEHDMTTTMDCH